MPSIESHDQKTYWRSLEELENRPEFQQLVAREFDGRSWDSLPPSTRRQFLKLMGASLALAGIAGCRWPKEEIVPFARPTGNAPGIPLQFATSREIAGAALGLLVTSFDGRPVKIEGNPSHPGSLGASDAISQASVLELYDPDRSKVVVRRAAGSRTTSSWEEFGAFIRMNPGTRPGDSGEGVHVLSEASSSPTLKRLRDRLVSRFPNLQWHEYEPNSRDQEREGSRLAFGHPYRMHASLERAKVIVCFDADPLHSHPEAVRYAHDFAAGRTAAQGWMSRLHVIESLFSVTGTVADHRHPVRADAVGPILGSLAVHLFGSRGVDPLIGEGWREKIPASYRDAGPTESFVLRMADDLLAHRGESVLFVGSRQPPAVHALAHWIHAALGNIGKTVHYTVDPDPGRPSHLDAITQLTARMRAGEVRTLLIMGGNPLYDAPADLQFDTILTSVETSIHLGLYEDETSQRCSWHLPRAHGLESWGDTRAFDGTIGLVQPLIAPLYHGKSGIELLSILLDEIPIGGYDLVRETFAGREEWSQFEPSWRRALHDGIIAESRFPLVEPPLSIESIPEDSSPRSKTSDLEIVFYADRKVLDGRFANNAWLQELPDPLTKLTWDNAAILAPALADRLGLAADEVVTMTLGERNIELPIYVMPGQPDGTVAVALGYGRAAAGRIGNGVGSNSYSIRTSDAFHFASGLVMRKTGRTRKLACTQNHHAIDRVGQKGISSRIGELVREADLETYLSHPDFAQHVVHHPPLISLWEEPEFQGHRWGMSIDLSTCIGCNACVIACQSENNVPVVGQDEVRRSREMHWLRIDRYFSGDAENPRVVHQPVACVQCENAPCEQVCPVAATSHSEEGLNQMVYNRCIGTRYCSNNCPYKVRRFNWFNNQKGITPVEKMVHNPDVSVRSRGVMEKCSYCVQRIEAVKIRAGNEHRPIRDGEIIPACAQACPTQAIVFGDLNDEASRIRRLHQDQRSYGLLEELNTQPRTRYLAKLRNPHPSSVPERGGEHS